MDAETHVVINGSREYLPQASQRHPHMRVILLEVNPAIIRQRLVERGQETPQEIETRIAHNQQLPLVSIPTCMYLIMIPH